MNIFLILVAWWMLDLCPPAPSQKTCIKISENSDGFGQIPWIGAFLIFISPTIAHKLSSGSLESVDKMLVEMNLKKHWESNVKNTIFDACACQAKYQNHVDSKHQPNNHKPVHLRNYFSSILHSTQCIHVLCKIWAYWAIGISPSTRLVTTLTAILNIHMFKSFLLLRFTCILPNL